MRRLHLDMRREGNLIVDTLQAQISFVRPQRVNQRRTCQASRLGHICERASALQVASHPDHVQPLETGHPGSAANGHAGQLLDF